MSVRAIQILAISGSLRAASSNTNLLRAAAVLAPPEVELNLFEGLADLPHFNPDRDSDETLTAVTEFRSLLQRADAVLISAPEYAHGVPGSLKNALDWVVGSGELVDKPVGLINAAPRSTYAQESLRETLTVMSSKLVPQASVSMSVPVRSLSVAEMTANPEVSATLRSAIDGLRAAVDARRAEAAVKVAET